MANAPTEKEAGSVSRQIVIESETSTLEGQLKLGKSRGFTLTCDEGPHAGGENTAPPPLSYLALAVGF